MVDGNFKTEIILLLSYWSGVSKFNGYFGEWRELGYSLFEIWNSSLASKLKYSFDTDQTYLLPKFVDKPSKNLFRLILSSLLIFLFAGREMVQNSRKWPKPASGPAAGPQNLQTPAFARDIRSNAGSNADSNAAFTERSNAKRKSNARF